MTGSMCLFPASLLHYTIPFESLEERIVLAFDVVIKKGNCIMSEMKEQIIKELKTEDGYEAAKIIVRPLNDIDIKDKDVTITHTLTSIFCPMADEITKNIKEAVERVKGVEVVKVKLTHTPPFTKEMMSEEARLTLNL